MEEHGGNIFGRNITLDFSVNINPLGMPPAVREAAVKGAALSYSYPDIEKRRLAAALAGKFRISAERIVTGNGAAELIYAVAAAFGPGRAMVMGPTFGEYETALRAYGWEVARYLADREDGYRFTDKMLHHLEKEEGIRAVFLCNPNNPTGALADPLLLKELARLCGKKEILLIIDECFLELTEKGEGNSLVPLLEECPHMVILRAFTKLYAMPGLRLGYALTGAEETAGKLARMLPPWNVSWPAQMAGCAALEEEVFVEKSREILLREEKWMEDQLTRLGFRVYPSDTVFCLFEGEKDLQEKCLEQGIYIRDGASFPGIREGTWRIGIRKREDNIRLLNILQKKDTGERRQIWQK